MRRDVRELREFYAQPLGLAVRETLTRKVFETWGDAPGVDMLGLGYATPFLEPFLSARRVTAAMPAQQGVEPWPAHGRRRSTLVDEAALPFPDAMFDRVLVVHGLEESDNPAALLAEVCRVMSGPGRVIIAAAARGGLWSNAEKLPSATAGRSRGSNSSGWCATPTSSPPPGRRPCMCRRGASWPTGPRRSSRSARRSGQGRQG